MVDKEKLKQFNEKSRHYVSVEALEEVMAFARLIPDDLVKEIYKDSEMEENLDSKMFFKDPENKVKTKIVECVSSLNIALQQAGGRIFSGEDLKKMSVMELITSVIGQNNIRFIYEGPDEKK